MSFASDFLSLIQIEIFYKFDPNQWDFGDEIMSLPIYLVRIRNRFINKKRKIVIDSSGYFKYFDFSEA